MQYNYGLCDKPVCEYCDLVRAATAGAVEPPVAATQKDLRTAQDDFENKLQTASLELEAQRADGDYELGKNLGVRIDAAVSGLVHGVSVDGVANDRKATDTDGTVYIVGPTPTGTFAGHANQIASLQGTVWHFQTPGANETHLNEADNQMYTWNGTAWVKVGTVGNSQKLNDEIHGATAKAVPGDNDEFAITDATETPAYALKKLTWGKLKTALWSSVSSLPMDNAPGNLPAGAIFPILDTDATPPAPYSTTFATIRDKIWKDAATVAPATGTLDNADKLPILDGSAANAGKQWWINWSTFKTQIFGALPDWVHSLTNLPGPAGELNGNGELFVRGSDNNTYKTKVSDIKDFVLAGALYRKKLISDGGNEDSMIFDISDYSGDPKMISIKGQVMATGTDNFRPSLFIKTNAGYINMETNYPTRAITSMFGDGGGSHTGGYANGYDHRCYLIDPVDGNYACKAGRPVYFDLSLSFETARWSGFGWSINYIGGSDGQITARGFCHGEIDASKITHIGIKCDTQGTGAFRNLYGEMNITVE